MGKIWRHVNQPTNNYLIRQSCHCNSSTNSEISNVLGLILNIFLAEAIRNRGGGNHGREKLGAWWVSENISSSSSLLTLYKHFLSPPNSRGHFRHCISVSTGFYNVQRLSAFHLI